MMGRWTVLALLLAALSSVFFIPSDSAVEKKLDLSSIVLPSPSIDFALPRIDHAGRRSDRAVETKIGQPSWNWRLDGRGYCPLSSARN